MKDFICGRNPILEWLDNDMAIAKIIISAEAKTKPVQTVIDIASRNHIPIERVSHGKLTNIIGHDKHQNIVAEVEIPGYVPFDDLLEKLQNINEPPLLAVLDGVQDPHNLGAVLRTAECANVHGIIIPKDKAAGITATVVKTSVGASAFVPVVQVTNIARTLNILKDEHIWIVGADQDGAQAYTDIDYKTGTAIVLGSEGRGMRRLVRESCDFLVSIPMYGRINSLNVSVAAALMFFQAREQRQAHQKTD